MKEKPLLPSAEWLFPFQAKLYFLKRILVSSTKITLRKGSKFRNLTMTITNLTVSDSGTYRCTEEKLTNHKASVNLKVNGKCLN